MTKIEELQRLCSLFLLETFEYIRILVEMPEDEVLKMLKNRLQPFLYIDICMSSFPMVTASLPLLPIGQKILRRCRSEKVNFLSIYSNLT